MLSRNSLPFFIINNIRAHAGTMAPLLIPVVGAVLHGTYQSLRHLVYNPDVVVSKANPFPWTDKNHDKNYTNLYDTFHTKEQVEAYVARNM